ncbi:MAG: xanthine dehydrogenase family protein molybdopterin-binding subunit [Alphaproteobacteria bacterium]|nr:xanthine dehydrogenase family protein molybdopterin-binding subunit [Alphaproteobacteria bacterium]
MAGDLLGKPIPRIEDRPLLTGRGRFVDDIHLPGMVHAAIVRSPLAHARLRGLHRGRAAAVEGVVAILAAADLEPHLATTTLSVGLPSKAYRLVVDRPVLATDEVRYVGEPVAIIIARSRYIAEDAAALVDLDLEPLPAVSDARLALRPEAPRAHSGAATNVVAEFTMAYGDLDGAFASAAHIVRTSLLQHRGVSHPIECRGAVGHYDAVQDCLVLWSSTQAPHSHARMLVKLLGCDENRVRVVSPDVGGGFGPKLVFYQEDILVALAARIVGAPVKWIEDRREHFMATTQERDQHWDMEIAADATGRILGVRGHMIHDHGAYTARGINLAQNSAQIVPGVYRVPAYELRVTLALTNRVPVSPVRGAGHPQGAFAMERLLDRVAQELGLDRAEVRRRNLIPPEALPYRLPIKTRGGTEMIYDSGDYPACQAAALAAIDYDGFRARQATARAEGRYLGVGIANYMKGTGRGPFESVTIRVGPSGRVSIYSGATAIGQGTKTMLAQICADAIGVDVARITVVTGDTGTIALGHGAASSRQAVNAGTSVHLAALAVRHKLLQAAAIHLEADATDLEIIGGTIRVKGVPAMAVGIGELADALAGLPGYGIPGGLEPGVEASRHALFEALTFAYGTTAAEVEVDIETGAVAIRRYVVAHDSGMMINPMMVDGQILGGAAHGIGNALYEWMGYDAAAQPVTTTSAEYLVPGAPEIPRIEMVHIEIPTPHNPLGVKGVGESGTIPAAAAVVSAVEDALAPFCVRIGETPIRPTRILELIAASRR